MKHGTLGVLVILFGSIAGPVATARSAGTAENPDADRKAVEAVERDWLNGISDRPTLERVLASDFVHPVSAGVFLSKEQHIEWSVHHPRPAGRTARFERLDVRLYGETAIATGIVAETDAAGADPRRTVFSDVFVRREGRWQAVNACETPVGAPPPR